MDKIYKRIGVSEIGPLHIKMGIPNQDCFDVVKFSFGNVVVVADDSAIAARAVDAENLGNARALRLLILRHRLRLH